MKHDISNHSNNITVQYYFIELINLIETVCEKYNDSDLNGNLVIPLISQFLEIVRNGNLGVKLRAYCF